MLVRRLKSKSPIMAQNPIGATSILFLALATLTTTTAVFCQDFEDLNTNNYNNENTNSRRLSSLAASINGNANNEANNQQQQTPQAFQSLASSRQHNPRHSISRPVLSSRFLSSSSASVSPVATLGQPLNAQASAAASVFSAPPTNFIQQQSVASTSNIEQLMKNALARTTGQQQAGAESRQDPIVAAAATNSESLAPQQILLQRPSLSPSPQVTPMSNQQQQQQQQQQPQQQTQQQQSASSAAERQPEASESSTEMTAAGLQDDGAKQTTAQADTTNGHETVYSDQRFANLFARRNNLKKSKINPTEQIKAKPTLPSFIKSPPDPKQFTAAASNLQERPATPASNSFASQRLQQAQSGRLIDRNINNNNNNNQQNKPKAAITSNSAAAASNKRANGLNSGNKPLASSVSSKPSGLGSQKAGTSSTIKPALPAANNPFGRNQNNNSDPANVIAMARKRLLANNALESAKLKQQQNAKQT